MGLNKSHDSARNCRHECNSCAATYRAARWQLVRVYARKVRVLHGHSICRMRSPKRNANKSPTLNDEIIITIIIYVPLLQLTS